jgi:ABC-type glycerol-3-phosphate transport system substrate-binding protein
MRKTAIFNIVCLLLIIGTSSCGGVPSEDDVYIKNASLDTTKEVNLKITGSGSDNKGVEAVISDFTSLYHNCNIEYEYVQNYITSLPKRLNEEPTSVDLFLTENIQPAVTGAKKVGTEVFIPYALDLYSVSDKLDLSKTFEGLKKNFEFMGAENTGALYAVPTGAEMRGMFINKTLLADHSLSVPTKYSEFMNCCQVLSKAGYIPIQLNPGTMGQITMFPYVANLIANAANYQDTYNKVNTCEAGISELFRQPFQELYDMVYNNYYNYKYIETTYSNFTSTNLTDMCRAFFNLVADADGNLVANVEASKVAFMPGTISMLTTLEKYKEDHHSNVDFGFSLSPLSEEGGFAYLSPAIGMAVNKGTANLDWSLEFMKFFFSAQENKKYASEQTLIPNINEAPSYITSKFTVDATHISQVGQVTFQYQFYNIIANALQNVAKANKPENLQTDGTMYPFDYFFNSTDNASSLESLFAAQRAKLEAAKETAA